MDAKDCVETTLSMQQTREQNEQVRLVWRAEGAAPRPSQSPAGPLFRKARQVPCFQWTQTALLDSPLIRYIRTFNRLDTQT